MSRRPFLAAAVALGVAATLLPQAAASPRGPAGPPGRPAPPPAAAVAPVEWGECVVPDLDPLFEEIEEITGEPAGIPEGYQCALYPVPLDHSRPSAGTVELALIRRPADDPAARQGSIFVNPGGPGGSGFEAVLFAGEAILRSDVAAQFDLVGFDPRGIARSDGLDCATGLQDFFGFYPFIWPETRADLRVVDRANKLVERDCARNGGPIRDNMSTTDVADDLDLLRQAVGDEELNFIGFSYGSYMGALYANRYPDRAGAIVVDGIIDPVDWATGRDRDRRPTSARLDSDVGAQETLEEFFRLCDEVGPERCAVAGGSEARFAALYDRLAAEPLLLELGPDVLPVDEQVLTALSLGPLYDSPFGFTDLGLTLWLLETLAAGEVPEAGLEAAATAGLERQLVEIPDYVAAAVQTNAVICADGDAPRRVQAWQEASVRSVGYFGPLWTWTDATCASWRVDRKDVYTGPFDRRTANPVLILSTRYDPATAVSGAFDLRAEMPDSRLVLVEGWGHTTLGLSECADAITSEYLLTRQVPAADVTCQQDVPPFLPLDLGEPVEPEPGAAELGVVPDAALEARVQQAEESLDDGAAELVRRRELVQQHVEPVPQALLPVEPVD